MTTVMCFGTFDLLHLGHLNYFEQAKQHGNHLIVVIARDKTKVDQNKNPLFSEEERLKLVNNLQIVDEAVLGNHDDHFKIILEKKPQVICLGYDHAVSEEVLRDKLSSCGLVANIIRAEPYKKSQHKSSILKEKVLKVL